MTSGKRTGAVEIDSTAPVRADGLSVAYGADTASPVWALKDVDLTVPSGRFVSLIGPSGCGKSTLLRVLAGLLEPTSGTLSAGGTTPGDLRRSRATGFMFQDPTLLPWMTVRQNIGVLARVAGRPIGSAEAERLAELVGLKDFLERYPDELSGGMRQRVALARSYALDPTLLLMDEPFGALDEITRQKMNDELLDVWEKKSPSVFFVTHSISEAVYLSDLVVVMAPRPGRIVAQVEIDIPRPRRAEMRFTSAFTEYVGEIHTALTEAMNS